MCQDNYIQDMEVRMRNGAAISFFQARAAGWLNPNLPSPVGARAIGKSYGFAENACEAYLFYDPPEYKDVLFYHRLVKSRNERQSE